MTCVSALRSGLIGSTSRVLNDSKGCGGVMRVAPLGAFAAWRWNPDQIYRSGVELAAITHGHPDGQHSSGTLAVTVVEPVRGRSLTEALAVVRCLTTARIHEVITVAVSLGETGDLNPDEIEGCLGGGWVGDRRTALPSLPPSPLLTLERACWQRRIIGATRIPPGRSVGTPSERSTAKGCSRRTGSTAPTSLHKSRMIW